MAADWEVAMGGMDLNMSMSSYSNASSVCTQAMNGGSCYSSVPPHPHLYGAPSGEPVDELLDLSHAGHEFVPAAAADNNGHLIPIAEHSGCMAGSGSRNSMSSSGHQTSFQLSFADDFYIPSEEAAELEWLSNFVDDTYSDIPNYASSSAAAAAHAAMMAASKGNHVVAGADNSIAAPGRGARSKRSRVNAAAAAAWHCLVPRSASQSSPSSSSSSSDFPSSKPMKGSNSQCNRGKKSVAGGGAGGGNGTDIGVEGGVRRCTHCASEKTPQWRTGPLGPKTLCNACGVRYKSGRLMPEYRPAASPTFLLTQHSNSHRKVMELRRQKELMVLRGSHRDAAASTAGGPAAQGGRPEMLFRDYGVC